MFSWKIIECFLNINFHSFRILTFWKHCYKISPTNIFDPTQLTIPQMTSTSIVKTPQKPEIINADELSDGDETMEEEDDTNEPDYETLTEDEIRVLLIEKYKYLSPIEKILYYNDMMAVSYREPLRHWI